MKTDGVSLYDEIQTAAAAIQHHSKVAPSVGVILGSGLGAFAERVASRTVLPYREIPNFPTSAVAGHKGELVMGEIGGVPCAVMSGRVHFYEGYDMQRVAFPVRVLAALGVRHLIVTNAAGAVNPDYSPGDLMVIRDHINMTGANPLTGPNDDRLGPRFPDMSAAYGPAGRQVLHAAAKAAGVSAREGVYVGLAGPSYETPAEIRMWGALGVDAVGMSTVGEVIVASHAGLDVAGMSVITNHAAGLSPTPLSHDEVKEVGERVKGVLCDILERAVAGIA